MNHATERSLDGAMAELRALRQAYGAAQKRCTASLQRLHARNQALEEEVLQLRAQLAARDVAMAWAQQAGFAADAAEHQQRPQMVGRIEALMQRLQTLLRSLRNPGASRVAVFGSGETMTGAGVAAPEAEGATPGAGGGVSGVGRVTDAGGAIADPRIAVFAAGTRTVSATPPAPTQPPVNAFVAPPSSAWPAPAVSMEDPSVASASMAASSMAGASAKRPATAGRSVAGATAADTMATGTATPGAALLRRAHGGHPGTTASPDAAAHTSLPEDDYADPPDLEERLVEADLVICQTGCLSHQAYWRVQDHCRRHNKTCVLVEQPDALRIIRIHQRDETGGTAVRESEGAAAHDPAGAMTQG